MAGGKDTADCMKRMCEQIQEAMEKSKAICSRLLIIISKCRNFSASIVILLREMFLLVKRG